jgi:hypothetical protein
MQTKHAHVFLQFNSLPLYLLFKLPHFITSFYELWFMLTTIQLHLAILFIVLFSYDSYFSWVNIFFYTLQVSWRQGSCAYLSIIPPRWTWCWLKQTFLSQLCWLLTMLNRNVCKSFLHWCQIMIRSPEIFMENILLPCLIFWALWTVYQLTHTNPRNF